MPRIKIDLHATVLLAFTLIAVAPLTAPGYFMFAHDARHTVYFLQMFDASLRDGAFYPRWAADMTFGYGYPLWIILAPLPYYLGEAFHLVGLDFVSAAKAIDGTALLASGLAMYLWASRTLGKDAGLLAAVAYAFIPYHLVDLYVRGAAPEFMSYVFPPLVLWACYDLIIGRRRVFGPVAALAYAGLVLTHIQSALLLSPLIGLYILLLWALGARSLQPAPRSERISFFAAPVASILLGLLLSATFLLPVVKEQPFLTSEPLIGGSFDFRQHFISAAQLLSPVWGYGYAGINGADQFSLQLGIMPLYLAAVSLVGLRRAGDRGVAPQLVLFAVVSLAVVLMMLPLSAPLWNLAAPIVAFVQFPWRLLIVTALTLAFLAGASVGQLGESERLIGAVLLSLFLVVAMFPDARPQYTVAQFNASTLMDFEVKDHELLGDTVWLAGERPKDSPLVAQYRAGAITQKAVIVEGEGQVEQVSRNSQGDEVRVTTGGPARLEFYTHYFPGWEATVDGKPAVIEPFGEQGLISVQVSAGTHVVRTHFGDTAPRQQGALLSLGGLAAVIGWLWKARSR